MSSKTPGVVAPPMAHGTPVDQWRLQTPAVGASVHCASVRSIGPSEVLVELARQDMELGYCQLGAQVVWTGDDAEI